MMSLVIKDLSGNPIFVGQEDPQNPPVAPLGGTQMQCPVCNGKFDYLLGDSYQACETCYDSHKDTKSKDTGSYDADKEIL